MNLYIFIVGTIIGSFINCLCYRYNHHQKIFTKRSYCEHCGYQLKWYDLMPLLSYLLLRGKCRYCYQKINKNNFLVELIFGISYLMIFYKTGNWIYLLIFSLLMLASLIDIKQYIIPDFIPIIIIIIGVCCLNNDYIDNIYGSLIITIPLILINFFKKGMGYGDIKLYFSLGLFLGIKKIILAYVISIFVAFFIGIYHLISRKITFKERIAFVPYITLGYLITILFNQEIIAFYLKMV